MEVELRKKHEMLHEGELEAQRRFGAEQTWNDFSLNAMFLDRIPPGLAMFLEAQPFFFISTANHRGECDCSFRGVEFDNSGQPCLPIKVLDEKTLAFPDYRGNNLYNSLGNILVNPHIGMLFVDFQSRSRARVNGRAEIIEDKGAYAEIWPRALRYVKVVVEQAYGNCNARIPRMAMS
ncbi:MAG: pyridoxamine 5'-phosphate oxidase family protein [Acidobacteriaceae bacterium]